MKKTVFGISALSLLFVAIVSLSSFQSPNTPCLDSTSLLEETTEIESTMSDEKEYYKGFKDGWDEGWKDVKGKYSYPPHPPHPAYPSYPASIDSYRDGYNAGFKAGRRKAQKS